MRTTSEPEIEENGETSFEGGRKGGSRKHQNRQSSEDLKVQQVQNL